MTIAPSCWWVSSGGQPLLTPSWLPAGLLPSTQVIHPICRLPQSTFRPPLSLPVGPTAVSNFQDDWAGKSLLPTSTGHNCDPAVLQQVSVVLRFSFGCLFTPLLPWHGELHKDAVPPLEKRTASGRKVVWTTSGNWSLLCRSTLSSHAWADCRRLCLVLLGPAGFAPSLTNVTAGGDLPAC